MRRCGVSGRWYVIHILIHAVAPSGETIQGFETYGQSVAPLLRLCYHWNHAVNLTKLPRPSKYMYVSTPER